MNPFRYERANDASTAVTMLAQMPTAAFLGGGTNLVDLMKLGVAKPDVLVDVAHQLAHDATQRRREADAAMHDELPSHALTYLSTPQRSMRQF